MRFRVLTAAVLALLASITAASAQGCGTTNPNCVVPTRPSGDSTKAAASTEFVATAISPLFTAPTPTRAGDIIYWNGSIWTNLPGNNSGTQFLQETSVGVPSWAAVSASGTLVSIVTYSSTQTITIPANATKAFIRMWGGTGGTGGSNSAAQPSGGTGAAGYLEKYLTGLTAGNTLAYTQGGAGGAGTNAPGAGGNGGPSSLASGTQSITTLTANGSNGSAAATTGTNSGTAGGTATNGDVNITGIAGGNAVAGNSAPSSFGIGGGSLYAPGAMGVAGVSTAGNAGRAGGLVILWFQ